MDEEEVNVVDLELLEGALNRPLHILGAVEVVPDLGADEDVLTLDGGVGSEEVLDGITNLTLVQVVPGTVEVTVSGVESAGDGLVGLTGGTLVGEGTETDAGDLDAVAKSEGLSGRHGCVRVSK